MSSRSDPRGAEAAARSLGYALARIRTPGNRELVEEYLQVRDRVEGVSVFTRANDAHALAGLDGQLGMLYPLASRRDLLAWHDWLVTGFAATSVEVRKASVRRFYRYLRDPEAYADARLRDQLAPLDAAAWISFGYFAHDIPVEEILTEDDVFALVRAAEHPRDRALVGVLYESGARLAEFLALERRHVELDDLGARVTIARSKTSPRRLRLVLSAKLLTEHLEAHPRDDRRAALWHSLDARPAYRHGPLLRKSLAGVLLAIAQRAGIRKPVHPHAFRHARATHLARILTEPQLRLFMGWSASSPMPKRYVHLSGRDVDHAILAHHGLRPYETGSVSAWT